MDPRIVRASVLITAGLMVVGAIGTWATAESEALGISISVGGTDGGRDGVIILACAAILAIAAFVKNKAMGVIGVLAALAAAATCIYDLIDINDTTGIEVGWGLWVALIASVVAVGDAVWLLVARRGDDTPPTSPPPPSGDATMPGVPSE